MSVRVERQGPVTTVVIDRREVKNAVDRPTAEALSAAFAAFDADPEARVGVRDLGAVTGNYREHCVVRETPARLIAPEYEAQDVEMADQMVLREYLCPVTGYRIDAELARAGEPLLHDIRLED